jgi:hypothetical protein
MLGKVDPATLPEVVTKQVTNDEGEEKKIDLGEIIGLPDFDVCSCLPLIFAMSRISNTRLISRKQLDEI